MNIYISTYHKDFAYEATYEATYEVTYEVPLMIFVIMQLIYQCSNIPPNTFGQYKPISLHPQIPPFFAFWLTFPPQVISEYHFGV